MYLLSPVIIEKIILLDRDEFIRKFKDLICIYREDLTSFGPVVTVWYEKILLGFYFCYAEKDFLIKEFYPIRLKKSLSSHNPFLYAIEAKQPISVLACGTAFQLKVWQSLTQIKINQPISYQRLAEIIGQKKSIRAIGNALNKNRLSFCLPCHRVIKSSNEIGGYRWGVELKQNILAYEKKIKPLKHELYGSF